MHGGGISTYCFFTAKMLAEAGNAVTVFTQDDNAKDYTISTRGDNIKLVKFNCNKDGLYKFLGYTARLSYAFASMVKKMIEKEGKPDIIEAQDYLGIAYYITQFKHAGYAFLADVPIIITLHSPAFIYLDYNRVSTYCFPDFFTGEMEKQAIAASDALISPTRFLVKEINRYMPLDTKAIAFIANPFKNENKPACNFHRNKIVCYGKLSPQKGSFELLKYFSELWEGGFKHTLQLIGGTDIVYHPEMKTMGQVVKDKYNRYIKRGLLQLKGKINPGQIEEHLQEAHVIIVPSIVDNMPYVVIEAMSLGKIVLASKQGGQCEMMQDGVSGFLFDHNVAGDFALKLHQILALTNDEVYSIGTNARKRIEETYAFQKILPQKITFFNEVNSNSKADSVFPFLHQEIIQNIFETETRIKGLLTVVIPYYNLGRYVDDCLASVIASTYKNVELLIINDGSTDSISIRKLEQLASFDKIRIINTQNNGIAAARNLGAATASGEYLAFLDADDKVAPTYYGKAVNVLKQKDNVFFVGAWVQYFENSKAVWPAFTPQPPYALVHNPINSSGLVYKRNAFLTGGLNDPKTDYGLEDYESVIQMLQNGFNGVVLPEVLFYYRVRSGSMIRNISREKLLYSNKYIAEKHAAFYTKFATQVINLLNANGPGYAYDNPSFGTNVSVRQEADKHFYSMVKNFIKRNNRLKRIAIALKKLRSIVC